MMRRERAQRERRRNEAMIVVEFEVAPVARGAPAD
jgi:hypothetical protein